MEKNAGWQSEITPQLTNFLSNVDSFYLSTSNSSGQPYTQHRGGPKGFLKVIDNKTLAFADFSGNRQYITTGNLNENDKAFIFLIDYPSKTRIKLWGTAKVIDNDKKLLDSLADESYRVRLERVILFTIKAWDVNCNQHIQQRFTEAYIKSITNPLNEKIKALEHQIKRILTANNTKPDLHN